MAHAHPVTMLDTTLQTMQQRDVPAGTGADMIKDWISVLKHTNGAEQASQSLQDLYDELHNMEPNAGRIQSLLNQIAQQTEHLSRTVASQYSDSLMQLAGSLRSFAVDLDRV